MIAYPASGIPRMDSLLRDARRVLVASDFDGTLCPIADSPEQVYLHPAMLGLLRNLTDSPRVKLAVISGRALADLSSRVPLDITLVGNHGLEILGGGLCFVHPATRQLRPELVTACHELSEAVEEWPEAWVEDKGLTLTLHYRRVEASMHSRVQTVARECLERHNMNFAVRSGKKAIELIPRIVWDKGAALNYIKRHAGPFDACVCLGDDRTDETMFRANRDQVNIKVGASRATKANYVVSGPEDVASVLLQIASY